MLGFVGAYLNGCFSSSSSGQETKQSVINKNSDSSLSSTINNKDVEIKGDQIAAGRDVNIDKRKIEVKGDAFFDSSKQVNFYKGLKQRYISITVMKKILDSIPSKETKIEIAAGGGKEGENLAKEVSDYLEKKGYRKAVMNPWSLNGNWDITEYHYDKADDTFRIDIHPQVNDQQIH